jgi:hypothetical protein
LTSTWRAKYLRIYDTLGGDLASPRPAHACDSSVESGADLADARKTTMIPGHNWPQRTTNIARRQMQRTFIGLVAVLIMVGAGPQRAHAAPPTVTPSPGYDARLQEQRNAAPYVAVAPGRRHLRSHHRRPRY